MNAAFEDYKERLSVIEAQIAQLIRSRRELADNFALTNCPVKPGDKVTIDGATMSVECVSTVIISGAAGPAWKLEGITADDMAWNVYATLMPQADGSYNFTLEGGANG